MPTLSRRRRLLILGICCMSLFIVGLDNTIVNIALPSIGQELNASVSGLQWSVDAYTLVLASLLLMAGSTADRIGRRRTFQTGLVVFATGSLLCGIAPSLGWLITFRVLQAIGGCMLNPVAMSIITNVFTDPRERAQAIGVWAGVIGLSMALGPVLGGLLVQTAGWRTIFWINVPIGLAALLLTALYVPESRAPNSRRIDVPGQVIVLVLLSCTTYAIIEGAGAGWTSPVILAASAVAAIAFAALLIVEPHRPEPLIDLRLFRSPPFAGATTIALCAFASFGGFLFLNTVYLQEVRGYQPQQAGLYTLPIAAMTIVFGPLSGRLVGSRGPRLSLIVAGIAICLSGIQLAWLRADTPLIWVLGAYAMFGLGFAMVNPPITNTAVSGLPRAQAGVAAAFASTSRQLGQVLGVAVLGAVLTANLHGPLRAGFADASRAGWWIIAVLGVVVLGVGILTTGRWAERRAAQFRPTQAPAEAPDGAAADFPTSMGIR